MYFTFCLLIYQIVLFITILFNVIVSKLDYDLTPLCLTTKMCPVIISWTNSVNEIISTSVTRLLSNFSSGQWPFKVALVCVIAFYMNTYLCMYIYIHIYVLHIWKYLFTKQLSINSFALKRFTLWGYLYCKYVCM